MDIRHSFEVACLSLGGNSVSFPKAKLRALIDASFLQTSLLCCSEADRVEMIDALLLGMPTSDSEFLVRMHACVHVF